MKGIILAGGAGTRLHPITHATIKQLLPVYDKPLIYYPLSTLMLAGVNDILLISTPDDLPRFRQLFGDGSKWGIKMSYKEQPSPDGIAQALIIGEEFIAGDNVWLILGDNIFFGHSLPKILEESAAENKGATVFGYYVSDPQRYGIVAFDEHKRALSIEEKPQQPKSNYAVTGIYLYDGRASELAKTIKPSARGELEITALNNLYLESGELNVRLLGRGFAWLDTGTHDSLLDASEFVRLVERRQGLKIACLEEIAYGNRWIDAQQLKQIAQQYSKNEYGEYLLNVLKEGRG